MKVTAVVIAAAFAGLSAAQSLSGLPSCAQSCATSAIPASCGIDVKCICSSSSFISGVTCCVATACDAADQKTTLEYAESLCSGAGVTNLPTAATCSSTSAGSSGSSTAALASSAATGSSASSVSSSAASAASSVLSSASSESAASTSSTASEASTSGSSTASSTASSTGSSSASAATASSSGSAGNRIVAQGFGVAGLIAGAVAMI